MKYVKCPRCNLNYMIEGEKYCNVCKNAFADKESTATKREGICEYIYHIYKDFEEYLNNNESLCDLSSITFESNCFPEYSNFHVQQLYLLRFAYAYAYEYKLMYTSLLTNNTVGPNITVTSIGCGNMIDYWSLVQALTETEKDGCVINYTGIDLIDWEYKVTARASDNVKFHQIDAVKFLKGKEALDSDVYFFPKSISEFTNSSFSEICDCFRTKPILNDKFSVLISIRPVDTWNRCDTNRSYELINSLKANGFVTTGDPDVYWQHSDPEARICDLDKQFTYPTQIVSTLNNIKDRCSAKMSKSFCRNGRCNKMNRLPMLKAKYVQYQIFTFNRENKI